MITDKEALTAARTLRDYCGERRCSECIFNAEADRPAADHADEDTLMPGA